MPGDNWFVCLFFGIRVGGDVQVADSAMARGRAGLSIIGVGSAAETSGGIVAAKG